MAKAKKESEVLELPVEEIPHTPIVRTVEEAIKLDIAVFDKYEARAAELKEKYGSIKIAGVEDKEGYEAAKLALRELRSARTGSEDDRKSAKSFYLECGRAIDGKAGWIEQVFLDLELPIKTQVKAVDEEKDRLRVEKIEKEKKRFWDRVNQLKELGASYNMGVVSFDALEFKEDTIRESDDDYFNGKIVTQFVELFNAKEKIRIAAEKAKQEEERLRQEQQKEFERQQQTLKEQQAEIDRQNKELEKKKFSAIEEQKKKRGKQLMDLGLTYNFGYESFVLRDVNVHHTEITVMDEAEWDKLIADITPVIEDRKKTIQEEKDAEQDRLNKEAIAKADGERQQREELQRQKEREELAEGKDSDRWVFFLKSLPKEFPIMESRQYQSMVQEAQDKIEAIKSLKATRKGFKTATV
jgi:hypothetical protein